MTSYQVTTNEALTALRSRLYESERETQTLTDDIFLVRLELQTTKSQVQLNAWVWVVVHAHSMYPHSAVNFRV
jgi:hypothetical protein